MDEKEFYEEKEKMLSMAIKGIDEIFFDDILKIKQLWVFENRVFKKTRKSVWSV